ncbi:MAG TPA: outer membrane beta-barrel protein [Bryobacteraceae bacterium]|nr:outer membrane beta-barrel protein [Bryobacteraceae bacterium]
MRSLSLLLLGAMSVCAQPFSFGLKGGVPLTDFLDASGFYQTNTNRYIVGPTIELRLPFGLGVELDALYRHLNYSESSSLLGLGSQQGTTTGSAWEFPLLAKYRFPSRIVRPYVDAGIAWDTLTGLTQTITETLPPTGNTTTTTTSNPAELHKNTTEGFVIGAGIDVHLLVIHISPEIRYTRWGAQHFLSSNGGLSSNQNQAEFLVGITF